MRLHSNLRQFGLITETVLAAASSEMIYLYDLITGSTLSSSSIKRIDMDGDDSWVLQTNVKHGVLAIFYQKEDYLHVAISTATSDESKANISFNKLKSASKLTCSLLSCSKGNFQHNNEALDMLSSTGLDKDATASLVSIRLDHSVKKALSAMEKARQINGDEKSSGTTLREIFDRAVSSLMKEINGPTHEVEVFVPPKRMKNGQWNGSLHYVSRTSIKGPNIPTCIPQSFIDGCIQITMTIVLEERQDKNRNPAKNILGLDARQILRDLIRTGRVCARIHFEGSYALQETGKKHPLSIALKALEHPVIDNPLSAFQMILEMIVNCIDLSERHLVIMLDHMILHAKADSIVETIHSGPKVDLSVSRNERNAISAGVRAVLEIIVGYSECNEAMLRVALVEELSSSAEAVLLARLLPNLLTKNPYLTNPHGNQKKHFVRSACQWISALSESFRDDLSWAKTASGDNCLALLLSTVAKITENSQALMLLKDSIGVAEMINKQKKTRAKQLATEASQMEEMPGYSIDRIVF